MRRANVTRDDFEKLMHEARAAMRQRQHPMMKRTAPDLVKRFPQVARPAWRGSCCGCQVATDRGGSDTRAHVRPENALTRRGTARHGTPTLARSTASRSRRQEIYYHICRG